MHLILCGKEQQLPADILLDPDGHRKRSKWDCSGIFYSRVCARKRRGEAKPLISLSSSFSKQWWSLFPQTTTHQATVLLLPVYCGLCSYKPKQESKSPCRARCHYEAVQIKCWCNWWQVGCPSLSCSLLLLSPVAPCPPWWGGRLVGWLSGGLHQARQALARQRLSLEEGTNRQTGDPQCEWSSCHEMGTVGQFGEGFSVTCNFTPGFCKVSCG